MFVGLLSQLACGGGGMSSATGSTSYTVTVTGVSGSTQHSTTVTLKSVDKRESMAFYVFESVSTNQNGHTVCVGTWTNIVRGG